MSNPFALIVEDDMLLADIFSRTLAEGGYTTAVISNGRIALDRIKSETPDLIVLDLHLPEVVGDDILDYILDEPRLADTKIIIASADAVRASQLSDKVTLTLIKPIDPLQLQKLAHRLKPSPV